MTATYSVQGTGWPRYLGLLRVSDDRVEVKGTSPCFRRLVGCRLVALERLALENRWTLVKSAGA
jgi:hypothetical protein